MTDLQREALRKRMEEVEAKIAAACARAGRPRADVTLIAVSKSVSAEIASYLPELGVLELGESRPQELWHKAAIVPKTVHWHLIGHLQRNKIERTLPLVSMIHSVDSARLLSALEEEAAKQGRTISVLLEVNVSREEQKHGFAPDELLELAERVAVLKNVVVNGLMTMAALGEDAEKSRGAFAELRRLRDQLSRQIMPPHDMNHLSMGMSGDFEVAIEEGATFVRIGSVLFETLSAES